MQISATRSGWPTGGAREIWKTVSFPEPSSVQWKKKLSVIHSPVEGLLEQGGIKLSAVVSDLFGVSGWAMLEHIAEGVTDVEVLAAEARGALRKKDAELKEALAGQLEPVYRMLLKQHMEQVRLLRRQVEELNQTLAQALREHIAALHRLSKIPGVDLCGRGTGGRDRAESGCLSERRTVCLVGGGVSGESAIGGRQR
jgi:hypothetical protein